MKTMSMITFVIGSIVACGQPNYTDPKVTDPDQKDTATTETKNTNKKDTLPPMSIDGYVSNAFDLTVDDERYSDSEDFYTRELERLTEAAVEAGYEDWNLTFDATIGLVDLKYNMNVFVASPGNRGFAGQTTLLSNASFSISIPQAARDEVFSLRAVKRINVTLTPPENLRRTEKPVRWCYNFSAEIADVRVDGEPLILNNFKTRITKYACTVDSNGIAIPPKK